MTDGPMSSWDLEVSRADLSVIRVVSGTQPLGEGEVLLAVERLAVTANILTYASLGDELGYWRLFPAAPGWGRIPARGHAVVVGSRRPDFDLGARFFGMFPMSSHVAAKPRRTRHGFADDEPSRRSLSAVYNQYFDTGRQTLVAMENAALFRPLIVASFVLDAYLREVAFFGARQVVFTSASSKTALGLAMLLDGVIPTVGATSSDRLDFVEKAGVYAQACTYGKPGAIDREKKTLIVDFAGADQLLGDVEDRDRDIGRASLPGRRNALAGGNVASVDAGYRSVLCPRSHREAISPVEAARLNPFPCARLEGVGDPERLSRRPPIRANFAPATMASFAIQATRGAARSQFGAKKKYSATRRAPSSPRINARTTERSQLMPTLKPTRRTDPMAEDDTMTKAETEGSCHDRDGARKPPRPRCRCGVRSLPCATRSISCSTASM